MLGYETTHPSSKKLYSPLLTVHQTLDTPKYSLLQSLPAEQTAALLRGGETG